MDEGLTETYGCTMTEVKDAMLLGAARGTRRDGRPFNIEKVSPTNLSSAFKPLERLWLGGGGFQDGFKRLGDPLVCFITVCTPLLQVLFLWEGKRGWAAPSISPRWSSPLAGGGGVVQTGIKCVRKNLDSFFVQYFFSRGFKRSSNIFNPV